MIAGALLICLAILAGLCWWRMHGYRRWFQLAANRDDRIDCQGLHRVTPVRIQPDGLHVDQGTELNGRSVFLYLTVRARLSGWLLDPYVEVQVGQCVYRQYFERGATGQRYLNLTPLYAAGVPTAPRIRLRGRGLRWRPDGTLLAFDPPRTEAATVLVLAPHPDDAEIAAFGLYASHRSWVVTVTAGETATSMVPADIPTAERTHWAARVRVAASLSVPELGAVPPEQRANLVYPDGALQSMFREPARAFHLACEPTLSRTLLRSSNPLPEFRGGSPECSWSGLIDELRILLALAKPDIIVCPNPRIDVHPDHVFTTVALEQALRDLPRKPLLFLYAVHVRGVPAFPFGPAESVIGVPPGRHTGWVAEHLYSHRLEPDQRRSKYSAIEALHTNGRSASSVTQALRAWVSGMDGNPASFLRRAPRPNEIYCLVRGEMLAGMLRSWVN